MESSAQATGNQVANPKPKDTALKVISSIFIAIGIILFSSGIYQIWQFSSAKKWPTAPGEILSSKITEKHGKGTTYRAEIHYQYRVGGQTYSADRLAFGYGGSSDHDYQQKIVKRLPAGQKNLCLLQS